MRLFYLDQHAIDSTHATIKPSIAFCLETSCDFSLLIVVFGKANFKAIAIHQSIHNFLNTVEDLSM